MHECLLQVNQESATYPPSDGRNDVKVDPLFAGKPVLTRVFPRGYPWSGGWNYSVHSAPSGMPIEQGWQFTEEAAHARVAALKAAYEQPKQ